MRFRISVLMLFVFVSSFICTGCTKSMSEKGADMMSGSYIGTMSAGGISYSDYIIKIEKSSKQQVRISCISMPKLFETVEFIVTMANGVAHSGSEKGQFSYGDREKSLSLLVYASGSFSGLKQ